MRLTKTICTLGPATSDPKSVKALAERGMSIARFNFSHGSHETHIPTIRMVREVSDKHGFGIALMLDTKGAEIRTGDRAEPLLVKKGELITFSHKLTKDKNPIITVNYPHFDKDVKDASAIIVDNGDLLFELVEVSKDRVVARAQGDASIGSRRHVNLPGADVSLPSLASKDWDDIRLACEEKMDFIALSFVRNAKEIREVRAFCKKHKWPDISLVSKIENAVAVRNIDEIIDASDGVMIARGDLGAEVPLEQLPAIQDDILERCRLAGKPVIVATHMLESMIKNPMPTRAEVTDIAHAALTGADSTMLSGETAAGKYPLLALEIMGKVLEETEKRANVFLDFSCEEPDGVGPHASAAVAMAHDIDADAIVVFTRTGKTALDVSRFRAPFPIHAFTDDAALRYRMKLLYGVFPHHLASHKDPKKLVADALAMLRDQGMKKGTRIVVVASQIEDGQDVRAVYARTL